MDKKYRGKTNSVIANKGAYQIKSIAVDGSEIIEAPDDLAVIKTHLIEKKRDIVAKMDLAVIDYTSEISALDELIAQIDALEKSKV